MGPFEAFTFNWDGKDYAIPAEEQLRVIAQIEDVVTAAELAQFTASRRNPPTAKLAMAYGILLRHVGVKVDGVPIGDKAVLKSLFGAKATVEKTTLVMLSLLSFMGALDDLAEADRKANPPEAAQPDAASS